MQDERWHAYRLAVIAGVEHRSFSAVCRDPEVIADPEEHFSIWRHLWREWKVARCVGDPEMQWTFWRWFQVIALPALLTGDRRSVAMPRVGVPLPR
jgi:hypothetical protein